ncbi:MAG: hypothetical protein ACUVX1_09660 [Chloroflexota bacterium]
MNRIWSLLLLSILVAVGAACATPTAGTPSPEPTATPPPRPTSVPVPAEAARAVEACQRDLAKRLNVPAEEVTVLEVEEVEWPDSSLGCPEPGKMYAQVITPGYRVLLKAKSQTYEYHTDQGDNVVLCQK